MSIYPIVKIKVVLDDTAVFPTFTGKYGIMVEQFLKEFPSAKMSIHNETEILNNALIKRKEGSCQIDINAHATIKDLNENQELFNSLMGFYFDSLTKFFNIVSFNSKYLSDFQIFYKNVVAMMRNKRIGRLKVIQQIQPSEYSAYEYIVNDLREWNSYSNYQGTTFSYHIIYSEIIEFSIDGALSHNSQKNSEILITPLITTV